MIPWTTGVPAGLAYVGVEVADADLMRAQVDPAFQRTELTPPRSEVADPGERLRRTGAMALAADTVTEAARRPSSRAG
ncbi:hypothetical protein [Streptomyces sp. NPDC005374]|uniref:hypothetical protein n=1 Tax=Streptomyces sp. NPDC005374 TaxID=3364713 RepID=UPI0036C8D028